MSGLSQIWWMHSRVATASSRPRGSFVETAFRWRKLLAAVAIFFVVIGAYYVGIKGEGRSAINRWRPQVIELWAGDDIYLTRGFPTPPIMVMTLTPFCLLPGPGTMAAWFAVKAALTMVVLVWMLQAIASSGTRLPTWGVAMALAVSARPIMGDLLHGNVNLWIMFLVVASIIAFRSEQDVWAGLCLSLAIACKLTPLLLLIYFIWKRAWTLAASTVAGLILWLFLIPGIVFGFERNQALLTHWADYMVWPYVASGQVETEQTNQSASALIYRLFTQETAIEARDGQGETTLTLVDVDPATLRQVWAGVACLMIVGLGIACRRHWPSRVSMGWFHEIGIVLLVMLMLSERSWKHHFVWLLPISLTLVAALVEFRQREPRSWRPWMIGSLLGVAFLLMAATSQDLLRPFAGEYGAKVFQAWGAYVWASVALVAAHLMALKGISRMNSSKNSWRKASLRYSSGPAFLTNRP